MPKVESKELKAFYHLYQIGEWEKAASILRILIKRGDDSGWIWSKPVLCVCDLSLKLKFRC